MEPPSKQPPAFNPPGAYVLLAMANVLSASQRLATLPPAGSFSSTLSAKSCLLH